jgi:hypothetical protein
MYFDDVSKTYNAMSAEMKSAILSELADSLKTKFLNLLDRTHDELPQSTVCQAWMIVPYLLIAETEMLNSSPAGKNLLCPPSEETLAILRDRVSYMNVVTQMLFTAFVDEGAVGRNPSMTLTLTNADGSLATIKVNNLIVDAETYTFPKDDTLKVTFE